MSTFWNDRFSSDEYVYGTSPNDFLVSVANQIPAGPVACLGEGEGRNAAFLARLGHEVTAIDQSAVGLAKAERLAAQRGVRITTLCADLAHVQLEPGEWSAVVAIFVHLPAPLRSTVLAAAKRWLSPGGVIVLESYTLRQLQYGTGGPSDPTLLPSWDELSFDLAGFDIVIGQEVDREVHEGSFHNGMSAVVQVLARRPA